MIFIFIFHSKIGANECDSLFRGNSLTINFGQLCLSEVNIGYERFLFKNRPHISFNGALAYTFYQMKESYQSLASPNFWADLLGYFWSQSFYSSVSMKKYFKKSLEGKWRKYLELEPFYRNNNFRKKMMHYDEGKDGSFTAINKLQSSTEHVIGMKLLYGIKTYSYTCKKNTFTYSFYFGLGVRVKYIHKTTYGGSASGATNHEYVEYNVPKMENYWAGWDSYDSSFPLFPSNHFGMRLGMGRKYNVEKNK